jgi:hypothetical protein
MKIKSVAGTVKSLRHLCLAAAAVAVVTTAGAAHAETCYDDWGAAGDIVRQEGLVTVESLAAKAAAELGGDIIKATLCEGDSGYIYRLVVRDPRGQLRSVMVPARRR